MDATDGVVAFGQIKQLVSGIVFDDTTIDLQKTEAMNKMFSIIITIITPFDNVHPDGQGWIKKIAQ